LTIIPRFQRFIEAEPNFETIWTEARKKALDKVSHVDGGGSSSKNGKATADGAEKRKDDKKGKKKKNKDKKKRKAKKRKRGTSTSSSGSENSNSDSESDGSSKKDSDQMDPKNSIRVAMRNFLAKATPSENDERTGKWTMVPPGSAKLVPPPPPSISQNHMKEKKKDEQIMNQWSAAPIISVDEKKMFESLKGRMKNQLQATEPEKQIKDQDKSVKKTDNEKDRFRERSRERGRNDRNYRGKRSRSRSRSPRRSRSRSRDRRYNRRYSRSRSRSYEQRRRVERPIVNFPPEPRLPPKKEEKLPSRSYISSKPVEKKKDDGSSSTKKMPFIGKMPVFKKQLSDKKSEEANELLREEEVPIVQEMEQEKQKDDTYGDDLMPDPIEFSAMMRPPPPPMQVATHDEQAEVLPPGLDPEDSEFIPKPISDAPVMRKGPLPKDFQETLDLLFDGDTPKPVVIEVKPPPEIVPEPPVMGPIDEDVPQMILAEDLSQHALLYGNFYGQQDGQAAAPPLPDSTVDGESKMMEAQMDISNEAADDDGNSEEISSKDQEMDDLALLGIDVNDVGSGMW